MTGGRALQTRANTPSTAPSFDASGMMFFFRTETLEDKQVLTTARQDDNTSERERDKGSCNREISAPQRGGTETEPP